MSEKKKSSHKDKKEDKKHGSSRASSHSKSKKSSKGEKDRKSRSHSKKGDESREGSRKGRSPPPEMMPELSDQHTPNFMGTPSQPTSRHLEDPLLMGGGALCVHHKEPLKYFCDSCEEPICNQCTIMGPHNTQLHRVTTIMDAFRGRFGMLSQVVNTSLIQKREKLLAQLHRLDYRIEEIKSVKGIVERDITAEYSGILERLRSAEGVKLAILQHSMADVQQDIERIDDVFGEIEDFARPMQAMMQGMDPGKGDASLAFLLKFRDLNYEIERSMTKPFKVDIDVYPHDLPRELAERRVNMERLETQAQLVKLKDDIIWHLIQEKKKKENIAISDLDKATQKEMNEWARLTDKYAQELMKYQLVCGYCGLHLDDTTVNTNCEKNMGTEESKPQPSPKPSQFTSEEPPFDYKGSHKHFFSKPHKSYFRHPFAGPTYSKLTEMARGDPKISTGLHKLSGAAKTAQTSLARDLKMGDKSGDGMISKEEAATKIKRAIVIDNDSLYALLDTVSETPGMVNYNTLIAAMEGKDQPTGGQGELGGTGRGENFGQYHTALGDMASMRAGGPPLHPPTSIYNPHEKQADWVRKVAEQIKNKQINLRSMLRQYDNTNSGYISVEEMKLVFQKLGLGLGVNEIDEIVQYFNRQGDRKINYEEVANKFYA